MKKIALYIFALTLLIYLPSADNPIDGYFVYIKGKKQYVQSEGKGEPTIIFLNGKGRTLDDFKKVYNKLKSDYKVLSYDRAGNGLSQFINSQRTVDTMAYELHELLLKEKIKPPYILVGHALGTYIMRYYVNQFPNTVAGLVFIEPSHEYEYSNGLAIRSDSDKIVLKEQYQSFLKIKDKTKGRQAESKYCFDFDSLGFSSNQKIVKDLKLPTNIPMSVILTTLSDAENDYTEQEIKYKLNYFENWKNSCPQLLLKTTSKSGHFIMKDEPSLVLDAIVDVISKIKKWN